MRSSFQIETRGVFLCLLCLLLMVSAAPSMTIILVATLPEQEEAYIEFLEEVFGPETAITAGAYTELDGNAQMRAELEAADLIVIVRRTTSGNYINGTEIEDWNSLSTPILCHSAYLTRQTRWNWMAGDRAAENLTHIRVADPDDPVFEGMGVQMGDDIQVFTSPTPIDVQDDAGNGMTAAAAPSTGRVFISRWSDTDVVYHDGSPYKPGGPRLFFGLYEFDSLGRLTEQGRMLLRNALLSLAPSYKGRVAYSGAGLWVQHRPARAATFSVVLNEPPSAPVQVQATPAVQGDRLWLDGAAGPAESVMLEFLPSNWDVPQPLTVHAAGGAGQIDRVTAEIRFELHSTDPSFHGPLIMPLEVSVFDAASNACPPADLNGDCRVDIRDLLTVAAEWLSAPAQSAIIDDSQVVNYHHLAALSEGWLEQAGPVIISELMASNSDTLVDGDGQASDWIELYNMTSVPIDLGGWYLTDKADDLTQWQFPVGVVIEPYDYYLLFASAKDDALYPYIDGEGFLHTHFALSKDGEYLALVAPDGQTVVCEYAPQFPPQVQDMAYGLAQMQPVYFAEATPGLPNSLETYEGIVADPIFSHPRGAYETPFEVSITCQTEGANVHYTLDGTAPTPTSAVYTAPLTISSTACLRAAAFKDGWYPSAVATQTYVFFADVPFQSAPEDYPTSWSGYPAHYTMTAQVYADPTYADQMTDALAALPIVSIVTDKDHLFDAAAGIYMNPVQRTVLWERPVSVEFFDPDGGQTGFQIDCGLRIQGGASRQPANSPKHSFRLLFKRIYGQGKLNYPLFGDDAAASFDTLVLRANYNNSWYHWDPAQRLATQYLRDQWARDTQRAMGQVSAHGRFVHLYLNGLYWGLYNISERPDASFSAAYFDGDKSEWDALKHGGIVTDGDAVRWTQAQAIAEAGVSDNAGYAALSEYVDIPNLIDYMIINFYGGNQDWGANNWRATAKREQGYGFRFFCWDTERTLEDAFGHNVTGVNHPNSPARFYAKLRENPEFRMQFADHAHRWLFNGGVLTPQACIDRWMTRAAQIDTAVIAESARWGIYRRDIHVRGSAVLYTRDEHWLAEQQRLLNEYFPIRSGVVIEQFKDAGLYPTTEAPVFYINDVYQHGGDVSVGDALTLLNPNASGTIYYTTDGSDPRRPGGGANPLATIYTTPIHITDPLQIKSRIWRNGVWSALNEATYTPGPITLMYFWCFTDDLPNNTPLESLEAVFSAAGQGRLEFRSALEGYPFDPDHESWRKASMERRNQPTSLNYRPEGNENRPYDADWMRGLQVRQPFALNGSENTIIFHLPATGYRNVLFSFAAMDEGAAEGLVVDYSVASGDPIWQTNGLSASEIGLKEAYQLCEIDFSQIPAVNNNPDFKIRIRFQVSDGSADAGHRVTFNNIALEGLAAE